MTPPFHVTILKVFATVLEFKKQKKPIKRSKTMTTEIQKTIEFIDHVKVSLEATYSHLWDKTREIIDSRKLTNHDRSHLEWGLAHMYKSKEEFLRDLSRHTDVLKHELLKDINAGKSL